MNTKITTPIEVPKNIFRIKVTTMEGDADDSHEFNIDININDIEELTQNVIYCEVLKAQYPHGQGGQDTYNSLDFWEEFSERHGRVLHMFGFKILWMNIK